MIESISQNINKLTLILGTDISKYDISFLDKTIQGRMDKRHCKSQEEYCSFLEKNKDEIVILLNSLRNNYSIFFRHTFTFSALKHVFLPLILQKKKETKNKEIRIWSAACASGQEAYSLAIVLEELKNGDNHKFEYLIFATDLSDSQIQKASKGQFAVDVLNNLSLKRFKQWFTKKGDGYTVISKLKKNIYFSTFDLLNDQLKSPPESVFGEFDIIMCANLLFYYTEDNKKRILKKIKENLSVGGIVITGETERDVFKKNNFIELIPQSAIFRVGNII